MQPVEATTDACPQCEKPRAICVCDRIEKRWPSRTEVLILRHPQESDRALGTARLAELSLAKAIVRTGLSWGSLSDAVGREVDPKHWGVLYLGSLVKPLTAAQVKKPLVLLDRHGDEVDPGKRTVQGIVVLDGTWSQAKTLWWRNPWMLKLQRVVLHPTEPSAYGKLREQSQRHHLATIEATAEALFALEGARETRDALKRIFRTMMQRARDAQKVGAPGVPPAPAPKTGRRPRPKRSRGAGPMD